MDNVIPQFCDAISAAGLTPPDTIKPGKMHRFPGQDKCKGNRAGWCIFFEDGLGGCFGDWTTGISENWQAKRDSPSSHAERAIYRRRIKATQLQVERERKEKYANAAQKAVAIWDAAAPAMFHEYLKQKQVFPMGIRVDQHNNLLVPMMGGQDIHSLQFIQPGGVKRFLKNAKTKGKYYPIELVKEPEKLLICEGFATGATLYMETRTPVIVAFYATNLVPVAKLIRKQYSNAAILICGDDDRRTEGNPGKQAAIAAARSCGGNWSIPDFTGLNPSFKDTDFNDLYRLRKVNQ